MPKYAEKELCPLDFLALRNKHAYNVEKIIAKTTMIAGYEDILEQGTSEAESMRINHRVTKEMYKLESEMPEFSTAGFLLPLYPNPAPGSSRLSTVTTATSFSDATSSFTKLESIACRKPNNKRSHKTCVRSEADTCHQSLQQAIRAGKLDGMLLGTSYLSRLAPRVDAKGLNTVAASQPHRKDIEALLSARSSKQSKETSVNNPGKRARGRRKKLSSENADMENGKAVQGSRKRSADSDSDTSSTTTTVCESVAETPIRHQPRCRGSRRRSADSDTSSTTTVCESDAETPIRRQPNVAENPTRSQPRRRCIDDTYEKMHQYRWLDEPR